MRIATRIRDLAKRVSKSRAGQTAGWGYVATGASVVTGVITARTLGPDHRGMLGLILSVAALAVMIGALGTTVSIRRHLPRGGKVNAAAYDRVSLWLLPFVVAVLTLSLVLLVQFVSGGFADPWIAGAFMVYGLGNYFSAQAFDLLNAHGEMAISAKISALGSFVCAVFVFGTFLLHLGLFAVVIAYAASVVVQALMTRLVLARIRGPRHWRESPEGVRLLLSDGVRLLGLNVGQALTEQASTIMLGVLSTPVAVGLFSVSKSPSTLTRHPAIALGQVALHDSAAGLDRRQVLRRIALLMVIFLPVTLVGIAVSDWVIPFVFGSDFAGAVPVFRILLVAELVFIPFLIGSKALAGGGSRAGASLSSLLGLGVLLIGGVALIPESGAEGAAWAVLVAQAAMSAAVLWGLIGVGSPASRSA